MKSKKRSPVFLIVFLTALAVFIVTTIKLATIFLGYQKEDSVYKELEQFAEVDPADTADTLHYNSPIDFESLWEINQETIAWIHFETMEINYPVVQGEDDDFYLHHGFYKEENNCGCIFMDTTSKADFTSENSFIYGHNMKNKSMFAKLNQYSDPDFYPEHTDFLIYTPQGTNRYRIYSCYPAELDWDSFTYEFDNQEEYAKWQQTVKGRSLYDTGITPEPGQNTVTLMTCTPKGSSYRFLVHAVLVE